MTTINTLKSTFKENFDTLKLYLTDIVAASESGFGSQPTNSLSNWLVGNILIHRDEVLTYLLIETEARWSPEEISTYFLESTSTSNQERKPYAKLLSDLKDSQRSLLNYFESLDDTEQQGIILDIDNSDVLNSLVNSTKETIESLSISKLLKLLAEHESKLTQQFAHEQRQNSKTGIY